MKIKSKHQKRHRRHRRVRAKASGTAKRPRLCVFRSARYIYAQLIDDEKSKTIISVSEKDLKKIKTITTKKTEAKAVGKDKEGKKEIVRAGKVAASYEVGKLIAQKALDKKIDKVVFDRGGYKYHGRIKALADGAREGGLKF